jgi:hypothetical protein
MSFIPLQCGTNNSLFYISQLLKHLCTLVTWDKPTYILTSRSLPERHCLKEGERDPRGIEEASERLHGEEKRCPSSPYFSYLKV